MEYSRSADETIKNTNGDYVASFVSSPSMASHKILWSPSEKHIVQPKLCLPLTTPPFIYASLSNSAGG